MKTAVVCILVALMGCAALASDRSLQWGDFDASITSTYVAKASSKKEGDGAGSKGAAGVGGYAYSKDGSVKLTGYADSKAYAVAISECKVILKKVFADARGKKFVYAKAKEHASALAKTFAAAFTKTYVKVESNGEKAKGCADAKAVGAAAAKGFALVYVEAITYIKSYYGYKYVQVQKSGDYAVLFSKAFSASASGVCASGYATSVAYQDSLAVAAAKAYLTAFAEACSYSYYGGIYGGSAGRSGGTHHTEEGEFVASKGDAYTETYGDGDGYAYTGDKVGASSNVLELCLKNEDYKHCCGYYPKGYYTKELKTCKKVYIEGKPVYETEKGYCKC